MNDLFKNQVVAPTKAKCLGKLFENEDARRTHYLELLAEKLRDPEFRKTEGFPLGSDEDILALSDPPYYTACPNPFIRDFIEYYSAMNSDGDKYSRQPLTEDIRHSRDTVIYSAHTYHTKVPPEAIKQYIQHFTKPGDLVLDAFSGSGMTGVACALFPAQERRIPVLCDLSPAATFITSTYLSPPDPIQFDDVSSQLIRTCAEELSDLWTLKSGNAGQLIEFDIWAEVFACPNCQGEIETIRVVDASEEIGTAKEFPCPHCGTLVSKAPTKASGASKLERNLKTRFDRSLNRSVEYVNRVPVLTQIRSSDGSRSLIPTPADHRDFLLKQSDVVAHWFPTNELIHGERYTLKDCLPAYGIKHIHHFYLTRQLETFSRMWAKAWKEPNSRLRKSLLFFLSSNALGFTVLNRYGPTHYSQVNKYFSGTLYVPSTIAETSPIYAYQNKRKRLTKAFAELRGGSGGFGLVTTQSSTQLAGIPDASIDYVFVDPPFGQNLQYSELNQIWEAWLRVRTDRAHEAVVDPTRHRDVMAYTKLMRDVFVELHRVLKPGRWTSVAFHNSSNLIWMAIQEALFAAGFVVADVRTLDKQRESYKQVRQGTVKQDLVITAYKPTESLVETLKLEAGTEEGVWAFVKNHLAHLPVFVKSEGNGEVIAERQDYLLFDRMVAFHVQRSYIVPLSASEFYAGLRQRYSERDGMFFLAEQVHEYDTQRAKVADVEQLSIFVTDEGSAIQWLRLNLEKKPQSFQEIQPKFLQEIAAWNKSETPIELERILSQNFICYDGKALVPTQIHSYLSSNFKELRQLEKDDSSLKEKAKDRWYVPDPGRQRDLELLREKELMKEFDAYVAHRGRKLSKFRHEAVRAGFKKAWSEKDYTTIVQVAHKIPDAYLQEDAMLLMWYDQALTRTEAGA